MKLTTKQVLFISEFLIDGNGARAVLMAVEIRVNLADSGLGRFFLSADHAIADGQAVWGRWCQKARGSNEQMTGRLGQGKKESRRRETSTAPAT